MKRNGLWIILLWAVMMLNATATNVYVCIPGVGGAQYPYTNWDMAATNIQDAVGAINTNGGNYVFVSNGTYFLTNQIVITNGVILQSWHDGVSDRTNTVIHGNNYPGKLVTNRCVYMAGRGGTLLGFTITGGIATNGGVTYGGGVFITNNGVISDCVISNNMGYQGGGLYLVNAIGTVENCVICSNRASSLAGGILCSAGTNTVRNCILAANSVLSTGSGAGGIYLGGDSNLLDQCEVRGNINSGNSSPKGGGIVLRSGAVARNCLVFDNQARQNGGGVALWSGGCKVINCTIISNRVTAADNGGGIASVDASIYFVENSIVYSNRTTAGGTYSNYYEFTTGAIRWTNCCSVPSLNDISPGTNVNNITDDPQFAGVSTGNFRLVRSSPCVNRGVNREWMTPQSGGLDLDGSRRIMMGIVDMGAYELAPPSGGVMIMR